MPPCDSAQTQLDSGRAAYARRSWKVAHQALTESDEAAPLAAEDLDRLAFCALMVGDTASGLKILERSYQAWLGAGNPRRAARAAFWTGFRSLMLGEAGRANAWFARAQRLVDDEPGECPEHGFLLLPVAFRFQRAGQTEAMQEIAEKIAAIGDRQEDPDLSVFGRNLQGRALLRRGQIEQGMVLLDESMVGVMADQVSPMLTGLIYCGTISSCQRVYAVDRAREWTRALTGWCEPQDGLVSFHGACLVHRAELLQIGGAWPESLVEARRAGTIVGDSDPATLSDALYQEGEIHRLLGDHTAAEQAFSASSQQGREPQPGLALLRLSQGRGEVARAAIDRVIAATVDSLACARFLPAALEIYVALGDLQLARQTCHRLEEIAEAFDTPWLVALAAQGRGMICLAEGDAPAGLGPLRRAFWIWQELGAPYEAARVRVELARACQALGDDEGAQLQRAAARVAFEELAAAPDLGALPGTVGAAAPKAPRGLTLRELQVLRQLATGKTNKAIAAELFLSEKTIDRHVSNIFVKTDVSSRAAATAFAYENGLV